MEDPASAPAIPLWRKLLTAVVPSRRRVGVATATLGAAPKVTPAPPSLRASQSLPSLVRRRRRRLSSPRGARYYVLDDSNGEAIYSGTPEELENGSAKYEARINKGAELLRIGDLSYPDAFGASNGLFRVVYEPVFSEAVGKTVFVSLEKVKEASLEELPALKEALADLAKSDKAAADKVAAKEAAKKAAAEAAVELPTAVEAAQRDIDAQKEPVVFVQDLLPLWDGMASLEACEVDMAKIYGGEVCADQADKHRDFLSKTSHTPPNFCRREVGNHTHILTTLGMRLFDQFAMERVMLSKWLAYPYRCNNTYCSRHADVIVVPSLELHYRCSFSWSWTAMTKTRDIIDHRKYWAMIKEKFHDPERGYEPLIVVHNSFVNGSPGHKYDSILRALSEESGSFQRRVALASIESNLRKDQFSHFPSGWSDGAAAELRIRKAGGSVAGPLLVSLPYPTSILEPARFAVDGPGDYSHKRPRPVAVSMSVGMERGEGINWIRKALSSQFAKHEHVQRLYRTRLGDTHAEYKVCRAGKDSGTNCGLSEDLTFWDLPTSSAFCIQPAGDTLTRSHFYVAALSGCIPVVFDGGEELFSSHSPTWWAWRAPPGAEAETGSPFLDFKRFAVVYDASAVRAGEIDVVADLVSMLENDPSHYAALRRGLDEVAPMFRYSEDLCLGAHCRDAFSGFLDMVRPLTGECLIHLGEHCDAKELARVSYVESPTECGKLCSGGRYEQCRYYSFTHDYGECLLYATCPSGKSFPATARSAGAITRSIAPCQKR